MWKTRITALLILIIGFGVAYFVYKSEPKVNGGTPNPAWFAKFPFKLGLDLSGGTHLVYKADLKDIGEKDVKDQMATLRTILEKRVNKSDISGSFGVAENLVQVQGTNQMIIDLPGVTDSSLAIKKIGQTPILEFKILNEDATKNVVVDKDGKATLDIGTLYQETGLTGRYLDKATLEFDQQTSQPTISIQFNSEGSALFEKITKENTGKQLAIFLDGEIISSPVIQEAISGGKAQISGSFTPKDAKELVQRLNLGALPVPISLVSTQTIGPSLGEKAVQDGMKAALIGLLAVALFLILWYRLPGIIAVIALSLYVSIVLALFKFIPVTLTAAGIAGFIISIGMAVDANVLIFERIKEEIKNGRTIGDAIHTGFSRAWFSIRDSNTSSIITSVILFGFGTSLIKGFAVAFGLGVVVSLLSAITISRVFLYTINVKKDTKFMKFLFSSGFSK